MTRVPFLDVGAANTELRPLLLDAFERVLDSGQYILGNEVSTFEEEFASYVATRFAVGVGNGLDALTLALRAAGIGSGDEVIVPAHTFIATWLSVLASGATPIPVDVDPYTLTIDAGATEAAVTRRTAALVPVHLYGFPCDVERLEKLASARGLRFIGDAAQAHGTAVGGRPIGSFGDAAAFSFYPAKNLGALGDGGAITTDDDAVASAARRLRNYGSRSKYDFVELGTNSRLDPVQAAMLSVKLSALTRWNEARARHAEAYLAALRGLAGLTLPAVPPSGSLHAWYAFCVRHPSRDELQRFLAQRGIETQIYYPVPPHRSSAFAEWNFREGAYPVTEQASKETLALPIGPHLDVGSRGFVIEAIRDFCGRHPEKD